LNWKRLTPLKEEKDQQRRGLNWGLSPNGKDIEKGLPWIVKKFPASKFTSKDRTASTCNDLSWTFEKTVRCPHGSAFPVVLCEKILQTVGRLLAMAAGGPTTKRVISATEMIKICVL